MTAHPETAYKTALLSMMVQGWQGQHSGPSVDVLLSIDMPIEIPWPSFETKISKQSIKPF